MCLRFSGKVRYNTLGEVKMYEDTESEYRKMEDLDWAAEDYRDWVFYFL